MVERQRNVHAHDLTNLTDVVGYECTPLVGELVCRHVVLNRVAAAPRTLHGAWKVPGLPLRMASAPKSVLSIVNPASARALRSLPISFGSSERDGVSVYMRTLSRYIPPSI